MSKLNPEEQRCAFGSGLSYLESHLLDLMTFTGALETIGTLLQRRNSDARYEGISDLDVEGLGLAVIGLSRGVSDLRERCHDVADYIREKTEISADDYQPGLPSDELLSHVAAQHQAHAKPEAAQ